MFMPPCSLETLRLTCLAWDLGTCGVPESGSCFAFSLSADDQNENDCRSCGTHLLLSVFTADRGVAEGDIGRVETFERNPSGFFLELFDTHSEDSPGMNRRIE